MLKKEKLIINIILRLFLFSTLTLSEKSTVEAKDRAAAETVNNNKELIEIAEDEQSLNKIRSKLNIDLSEYPEKSPIIGDSQLAENLQKNKKMSRKEKIVLAAAYLYRFAAPSDLKIIRGEHFE